MCCLDSCSGVLMRRTKTEKLGKSLRRRYWHCACVVNICCSMPRGIYLILSHAARDCLPPSRMQGSREKQIEPFPHPNSLLILSLKFWRRCGKLRTHVHIFLPATPTQHKLLTSARLPAEGPFPFPEWGRLRNNRNWRR